MITLAFACTSRSTCKEKTEKKNTLSKCCKELCGFDEETDLVTLARKGTLVTHV